LENTRPGARKIAAKLPTQLVKKREFQITCNSSFIFRALTRPAKTPALLSQEKKSMSLVSRFLRDEAGATAIEYGLIAAGISVAIIATVAGLGSKLNTTFTSVQNALN
jgi:pilus assembly protein Flp/PilA